MWLPVEARIGLPGLSAVRAASATSPAPAMSTSKPIHVGMEGQRTTATPTRVIDAVGENHFMTDLYVLPPNLPEPPDDGAADHLLGVHLPALRLTSTTEETVELAALTGLTVLYAYPLTGRPGTELPTGWDGIPGARGCTAEACAFRDHHADLIAAGADAVYGLSTQDTAYQREVVDRLHLPFAMLSDPDLRLGAVLGLPTFTVDGRQLYRRITLLLRDALVEHVFYPVFPPDQHPQQVLEQLRRGLPSQ